MACVYSENMWRNQYGQICIIKLLCFNKFYDSVSYNSFHFLRTQCFMLQLSNHNMSESVNINTNLKRMKTLFSFFLIHCSVSLQFTTRVLGILHFPVYKTEQISSKNVTKSYNSSCHSHLKVFKCRMWGVTKTLIYFTVSKWVFRCRNK